MPPLRLRLFGRFSANDENRSIEGLDASKAQELLCYLLLHPKAHAREALASVLWADSSTAQSKKYLRQTLWQLQSTLESRLGPLPHRVALVQAEWVRLNPALDLWLDVAVFENAFSLLQTESNVELKLSTAKAVQEAVELYRGDLLEGYYQDWCLYERERLQNMYLVMLERLIAHSESRSEYDRGLSYAAQALRYEHASERTHRHIMRLYYFAGDRTAALRQYDRCVAALQAEFDVKPTLRTVELFRQIQADQLTPAGEPSPKLTSESAKGLLPEVLNHLKEVRATLSAIQAQVQKEIRIVEAFTNRR